MEDDKRLKGTTTVGIICDKGVVLATEKRATMGSFIASRTAKKIYQIDDGIAMTTAGGVGDAQTLVRVMKVEAGIYKMRRQESMTVRAASNLLSNILSGQRYFPFYVQLLTGGFDKNGASMYSLDALGGMIEEKHAAATGSGSPIAYGVLEDRYSDGMSMDGGTELAVRAIHTAMKRDAASGDEVEVVKITDGSYYTLTDEEVRSIRSNLN